MGFAAMLLIGYLVVAGNVTGKTVEASKSVAADRIAREFQDELLLATQVHDGYTRTFMIDDSVQEIPVSVTNGSGIIAVGVGDVSTQIRVPEYQGTPSTGYNTITKQNGVIAFQ